jgi:hypothetical protein
VEEDREVLLVADTTATNEAGLTTALADPSSKIIALTGTASLSGGMVIPAGKTLILYNGLDTNSQTLSIAGIVKVGAGGTLTAASAGVATVTGSVEVYQGGTLEADWATDLASVTTAFGYVAAGTLDLSGATLSTLKPSDLAGISGINAKRGLIATATEDEDAANLNIPAGAVLTAKASDDFGDSTSLSVYGSLTASDATGASAGIAITVGPGASLVVGDIDLLKNSSAAAGASLTTGDVIAFDGSATLTAYAGAAVNGITFPRLASISALKTVEVTIGGTLTLQGTDTLDLGSTADLVLDNNAVLVLPVSAEVEGTKLIKAEDGSGSITIAGIPGFTTTSTGVVGNDFTATHTKLAADIAKLANVPALDLYTTFGASVTGIGSAALASSSAVDVKAEDDASGGGSEIGFDTGTALAAGITGQATAKAGTDEDDVTLSNVTLSISSNKLQIEDSDAQNSTPKYAVVTFTDIQIGNGELVSPVLLAFNIGLKTNRT